MSAAQGVVAEIEPLRTVIRDDSGNPVYLSNSEVASYGVRNLTQVGCCPAAVGRVPEQPGTVHPAWWHGKPLLLAEHLDRAS
jgi:hypothetical protein